MKQFAKIILLLTVVLCVSNAFSQTNSLTVTTKDGSKNFFDLNSIKRIKFQSSNLEISYQNKIEMISLPTIQLLSFGLYASYSATNEKSTLCVYPNPAHHFLSIAGISTPINQVVIYSANGIRLLNLSNCQSDDKIDISTLSKGLYFVKVNNETIKFIKI
jgi:hypothetical protein